MVSFFGGGDAVQRISAPVGRNALRDVIVSITVVILVASSWALVSPHGLGAYSPVRTHYVYILAYCYIIVLLPPIFGRKNPFYAITVFSGFILTAFLTADLTTIRFFNSPFVNVYPNLPVTAGSSSIRSLGGYIASYVPISIWLIAAATIFLALCASKALRSRRRARLTILVLVPVFYAGLSLSTAGNGPLDPRISALMEEGREPLKDLVGSDRSGSFTLAEGPRAEPKTIILVVMESTGASTPSSGGTKLLSESIIESSETDGWVNFENAVTNSNATDISVPSLLTGSGAHEPIEKVHALPFISQYARARGYRTAFVTSSTIRWGDFESFLSDAHIDELITAEESVLPFINDLAVDDHFAYHAAAKTIESSSGKLFLTLYPQALHWPFQTSSAFTIPADIRDRRARAAYITESGFKMLFESLRKTARLEDSLIVIAGDHGEFGYSSTLRLPRMRLDTFNEGILSPIFLVKAPASMSRRDFENLEANSHRLVANIDIAPTFADLFRTELADGLSYDGYSLLADVPDDRVVYSTSTNEWRHWPTATIAVSRGSERLVCDHSHRCRLGTAQGTHVTFVSEAKPDDDLFDLAAKNPVLRQALGQIYRRFHN